MSREFLAREEFQIPDAPQIPPSETYFPPSESAMAWGCSNDDNVRKSVTPIEDGRERSSEALATRRQARVRKPDRL